MKKEVLLSAVDVVAAAAIVMMTLMVTLSDQFIYDNNLIYIAPYSTVLFGDAFCNIIIIIIIPDSYLLQSSTHLNSQWSIQGMLPL